jgi:hypothetical protein
MLISSSNQTCFEHARAIFYIPQKDFSNGVLNPPIEDHLTPTLREFVVGNQIPNLTPNPSFDHNSCISNLNEQCEGTLGIYTSIPFQWYYSGPIWCLFSFPTKGSNHLGLLHDCNSQKGNVLASH